MLQINRFVTPPVFEYNLFKPSIQGLGDLARLLAKKAEESKQLQKDLLTTAQIKHLPQDAQAAISYMQSVYDRTTSILDKYGHDYAAAYHDLIRLKYDISRETAPGTQPYLINQNYEDYIKAVEKNRERMQKGEITTAQVAGFENYVNTHYKGALPVTSGDVTTYERINLPNIVPYVDVDKLADNEIKNLPVREETSPTDLQFDPNTGFYHFTTVTRRFVDPKEAEAALRRSIAQDPLARQFIHQQRVFSTPPGQTPPTEEEAVTEWIDLYADQELPAKVGLLQKSKVPHYMKGESGQGGGDTVSVTVNSSPSYLGMNVPNQAVQPTDGAPSRALIEGREDVYVSLESPFVVPPYGYDRPSAGPLNRATPKLKATDEVLPMSEVLKDTQKFSKYFNTALVRRIDKDYKNIPEKLKWEIYNKNVRPDYGVLQYWSINAPDAQSATAKAVFNKMAQAGTVIYEVNAATNRLTLKSDKDTYNTVWQGLKKYTEDPKDAAAYPLLGFSSPIGGFAPLGAVIASNDGKKTYIVTINTQSINDFNFAKGTTGNEYDSLRYALFGFAALGREAGSVKPVTFLDAQGKPVQKLISARLEYVRSSPSSDDYVATIRYYETTSDGKGGYKIDWNRDPKTGHPKGLLVKENGEPWNEEDMAAAIVAPLYRETVPLNRIGTSSRTQTSMFDVKGQTF